MDAAQEAQKVGGSIPGCSTLHVEMSLGKIKDTEDTIVVARYRRYVSV